MRAVDPAPGSGQARYEIFHDRLAAPILDWRQQRENARLDRARERAEQEAEVQRTQARRFKRRARIMFALAVGLLVLLVAVAVLLGYARHQSDTASRRRPPRSGAPPRRRTSGSRPEPSRSSPPGPTSPCCCTSPRTTRAPSRAAERSLRATLHSVQLSGACRRSCTVTPTRSRASRSAAVGSTLASASGDKTIRLWTVGRGRSLPAGARRFGPTARCTASRSIRPVRCSRLEASTTSSCGTSAVTRGRATIPDATRCGHECRVQPRTATCSPPGVLTEPCSYGTRRLTGARRCTSRTEDWSAASRSAHGGDLLATSSGESVVAVESHHRHQSRAAPVWIRPARS